MSKRKTISYIIYIFLLILSMLAGMAAGIFSSVFGGGESLNTDVRSGKDVNVLVLGTDKSGLRSDTIMLACYNSVAGEVNVLSVPRDTRTRINGSAAKINSALGIGGEALTIEKVKEITGLPIHYYLTVNFEAVENIIDILGGVEFDVPQRMYYRDPTQDLLIDLQPGVQVLNGHDSVDLLRFRSYPMADLKRIEVQQAFVTAFINQKLNAKNIAKVGSILNEVRENINTNMNTKNVLNLALILNKVGSENLHMYQMPGTTRTIGGASYVICNQQETNNLIQSRFLKIIP